MWSNLGNAIKSDLMNFVQTIHQDTSTAVNKVIGETDEEAEEISFRERRLLDLKRSHGTYHNPVEEENKREFEKFLKTFSLSTYANEIAEILDEEVDVSRYYADLVPVHLTPDEFWARYFFKLMILMRGGIAPLDDDDDEELTWDDAESENPLASTQAVSGDMTNPNPSQTIKILKEENERLKGTIKSLVARVSELETLLSASTPGKSHSTPAPEVEGGGPFSTSSPEGGRRETANLPLDALSVENTSPSKSNSISIPNARLELQSKVTKSKVKHESLSPKKDGIGEEAHRGEDAHEVTIREEDIEMLVVELEVTREEAEAALSKSEGSVERALRR